MITATLNGLFLVAYLLSAAVQYNDPDTLPWIAIYLAAALMCLARFTGHQPLWLAPTLLAISLVWAGLLLPEVFGQVSPQEVVESLSMRTREVEEAREIGGLLLVASWSAVLTALGFRQTRSTSPPP